MSTKSEKVPRETKTINVTVVVPTAPKVFEGLRQRFLRVPRTWRLSGGFIVLAFIVAAMTRSMLIDDRLSHAVENGLVAKAGESLIPTYQTSLPSGKTIQQLGGWKRVSPPSAAPVFAYADALGDAHITVSEQPIPDTFKPDIDINVGSLAAAYNASQKITVGKTTVYIGTSAQGPQSVIFRKNNVLILIKSTAKIGNDDWAGYIQSLR